LLMQKNKDADATVTVLHSRSRNLAEITRSADILIAAIGQANFVKAEYVRDGAVVVDVGINRVRTRQPNAVIGWWAMLRLMKWQKKRAQSHRCPAASAR